MGSHSYRENECIALINGQHFCYDDASVAPPQGAHSEKEWEYLGEGVIYSVNGTKQRGETRLHFWRRK